MDGETVLLATGNPALDDALGRALADNQMTVVVAPVYYREALERPDVIKGATVVVLSVKLEGTIAFDEVIRRLRRKNLRVVLLAGDMELDGLRGARELGVYDIMVDPIIPETVVQLILNPATFADAEEVQSLAERQTKIADTPANVKRFTGFPNLPWKSKEPERTPGLIGEIPGPPAIRQDVASGSDAGSRLLAAPGAAGFVALGHVEGVPSLRTVKEVVAAGPRAILVPGPQAIKDLRRESALVAVPIVVVGPQDPVACLAAGADECISALDQQAINLILARAASKKDLWARPDMNGLTGCYSRDFLDDYVAAHSGVASVLMADLDHFKQVNDTYGHAAGDEVLREFGAFLRQRVRDTDIVARYGGEEFVVLFTLATDAFTRADELCREWARKHIRIPGAKAITSTFSGGFAAGPQSLANLIQAADQAMYQAKKAGRNRVVRAGASNQVGDMVDRVARVVGDYTLICLLAREAGGQAYMVADARGPFAGQLIEEVVPIRAEDGVRIYSGDHWLFGLSSQTLLMQRHDKAILVGSRGRFNKSLIGKLSKCLEEV